MQEICCLQRMLSSRKGEYKMSEEMTNDKTVREEMMNEYKMLREEIMYIMNTRKKLSLALIAFVPPYVMFSTKMTDSYLYFFIACATIYVMHNVVCDYWYRLMKISAYMIVRLEPHLKGVQWESHSLRLLQKERDNERNSATEWYKKFLNFLKKQTSGIVHFELVFMYLCVGIIISGELATVSLCSKIFCALLLIAMFLHMLYKIYKTSNGLEEREKMIKKWKDALEKNE